MNRPTGVSVISVLLWLVGIANILSGMAAFDEISTFYGLLQLGIGIAAIACGVGCWRLRSWARSGTIGLMGLNVLGLIGVWVQYSDRIIVSRLMVPLVINVVVIAYLMQSNVSEAFAD